MALQGGVKVSYFYKGRDIEGFPSVIVNPQKHYYYLIVEYNPFFGVSFVEQVEFIQNERLFKHEVQNGRPGEAGYLGYQTEGVLLHRVNLSSPGLPLSLLPLLQQLLLTEVRRLQHDGRFIVRNVLMSPPLGEAEEIELTSTQ